jgi:hypothetical protein
MSPPATRCAADGGKPALDHPVADMPTQICQLSASFWAGCHAGVVEEGCDVAAEHVGFLGGWEVAAAGHGRPPADVVQALGPLVGWRAVVDELVTENGYRLACLIAVRNQRRRRPDPPRTRHTRRRPATHPQTAPRARQRHSQPALTTPASTTSRQHQHRQRRKATPSPRQHRPQNSPATQHQPAKNRKQDQLSATARMSQAYVNMKRGQV